EKEGIVTVRRVDFRIDDVAAVADQRLYDLVRALRRETPVGAEAREQESGCGWRECAGEITASVAGRVEVVERARDQQVGIGVEILGELVALVAQIALDLELDVVVELVVV